MTNKRDDIESGYWDDGALRFHEYWDMIKRHQALMACITLLVAGAILFEQWTQPPVYEAQGILLIDNIPGPSVFFSTPTSLDKNEMDEYLNTQVNILKSRSLTRKVIDQLPLPPTDRKHRKESLMSKKINAFISTLQVSNIKNSRLLEVKFRSPDPVLAARIVNALFRQYIDFNLQQQNEWTQQSADFLSKQIATLRNDLAQKEKKLQDYSKDTELFFLEGKGTSEGEKFAELNKALTDAQVFRIQKESIYTELKNKPFHDYPQVRSDPSIQNLKKELSALEVEYQQKCQIFKDLYPEMQQLSSRMAFLRKRIADETQDTGRNVLLEVKAEYEAAKKREETLRRFLSLQKGSVITANNNVIYYQTLKIEIQNMRDLLSQLIRKQGETAINSKQDQASSVNIRIIDWAEVPSSPVPSKLPLTIFIALSIGLGAGLGTILLLEFVLKNRHPSGTDEKPLTRLWRTIFTKKGNPMFRSGGEPNE